MKKSILKPIIGGVFMGAFVFFTGPLLLIVFLLKFIFTPFGMGRMGMMNRGFGFSRTGMPPLAFAEKIRNMNDEEFTNFQTRIKNRFENRCGAQTFNS